MNEHAMDEPLDEYEAAAVDALFGDGAAGSPDAGVEAEMRAELDAFRLACREALSVDSVDSVATGAEHASESMRAQRVARRVLARTTREDLGRRGDVGLVLDFVAERLRDSALLRVAAALLLVQVTVVPLVAWHILRTPEIEGLSLSIEPPVDDLVEEPPVEEPIEVVGGSDWSDADAALERLRLEESIAASIADLERVARRLEMSGAANPTSALGRALAELGGATHDTAADSVAPTSHAEALVRVEAGLRRLSTGGSWRGLPEALEGAAAFAESGSVSKRGVELTGRAFAHARLLGVATPALDGSKAIADDGGRDWLGDLASEVESVESSDPYVAAWVDAVREL